MLATTPRSWVISSMAMLSLACRSRSSCRICAWMVTSSAVVGSSAISSAGRQISAMAIIARWRMPPDSSNGYMSIARFGLGNPTRPSISMVRSRRSRLVRARMDLQRLADLVADRVQRRQRGHRLLEDLADAAAAQRPDLRPVARQLQNVGGRPGSLRIGEQDAPGDACRPRQDAHDRLADDGFSGAGFADQRRHLAGQDAQIGAFDGLNPAPEQREGDAQILDTQQVCTRRHAQCRLSPGASSHKRAPVPPSRDTSPRDFACLVQERR